MGKKKKKLKHKVNPEKSNKMIIAVVIGLVIVLAAFLLFTILGSSGGKAPETTEEKDAFMKKELKYLETTEGIAELKYYPEENKVIIVYESYKGDLHDYPKIARYAGLKLSNGMEDESVTILVAKDKEEQTVHSVTLKSGRITNEKILSPGS